MLTTKWVGDRLARGPIGCILGAFFYLAPNLREMTRATQESIGARAEREDEGEYTTLVLMLIATVAALVTFPAQRVAANDTASRVNAPHISLAP